MRPSATSITCSAQAACPPPSCGRYWPNAGEPFATVGSSRDPRQPIPHPSSHCRMLSFPRIHSGYGGMDSVASSASSAVSESRS